MVFHLSILNIWDVEDFQQLGLYSPMVLTFPLFVCLFFSWRHLCMSHTELAGVLLSIQVFSCWLNLPEPVWMGPTWICEWKDIWYPKIQAMLGGPIQFSVGTRQVNFAQWFPLFRFCSWPHLLIPEVNPLKSEPECSLVIRRGKFSVQSTSRIKLLLIYVGGLAVLTVYLFYPLEFPCNLHVWVWLFVSCDPGRSWAAIVLQSCTINKGVSSSWQILKNFGIFLLANCLWTDGRAFPFSQTSKFFLFCHLKQSDLKPAE